MATTFSATAEVTPLRSTAAGTCACEWTLLRWNCTDRECCSSWWCCRLRWHPRTRRRCCRCLGWRIASLWTWQSLDTSKKKHQEICDLGFHYHLDHLNHTCIHESLELPYLECRRRSCTCQQVLDIPECSCCILHWWWMSCTHSISVTALQEWQVRKWVDKRTEKRNVQPQTWTRDLEMIVYWLVLASVHDATLINEPIFFIFLTG